MHKPYKAYLLATRNLLRYLKGIKNLAIAYITIGNFQPIGYSDSDFAGDKGTSRSTYGYLYSLAGRPISWKSKKATTIALLTTEAKANSLTEAIQEL